MLNGRFQLRRRIAASPVRTRLVRSHDHAPGERSVVPRPVPGQHHPAEPVEQGREDVPGVEPPWRRPTSPAPGPAPGPSNNVQLGPQKITKWQNHTARLDHQFTTSMKAVRQLYVQPRVGQAASAGHHDPRFDSSRNIGYLGSPHRFARGHLGCQPDDGQRFPRQLLRDAATTAHSIVRDQDYASLIGMGGMGLPKTCLPRHHYRWTHRSGQPYPGLREQDPSRKPSR